MAGRRHDLVPSEKNTNWEGAFRVPCLVRWPGTIKPGTVTNELMSHNDWICAAAGEPDIVNKLKAGYTANGINYKVHLDVINWSSCATSAGPPRTTTGQKVAATGSSTPTTMVCSWPTGTAITNTFSPSSACRARWAFGLNRSRRSAYRRFSTNTVLHGPFSITVGGSYRPVGRRISLRDRRDHRAISARLWWVSVKNWEDAGRFLRAAHAGHDGPLG